MINRVTAEAASTRVEMTDTGMLHISSMVTCGKGGSPENDSGDSK